MVWKEKLYLNAALPFSLQSAPKIFNSMADTLQWLLEAQGVKTIQYLNDFLTVGVPDSGKCKLALERIVRLCTSLGVPIVHHNTEGPTCRITFLGIEPDSESGTVRPPKEKLLRFQKEIRWWMDRLSCTKRELLSLISQLQHACGMVRPGRVFLRCMISLAKAVKRTKPPYQAQQGIQIRPPVVGLLSSNMEWNQHDVRSFIPL